MKCPVCKGEGTLDCGVFGQLTCERCNGSGEDIDLAALLIMAGFAGELSKINVDQNIALGQARKAYRLADALAQVRAERL